VETDRGEERSRSHQRLHFADCISQLEFISILLRPVSALEFAERYMPFGRCSNLELIVRLADEEGEVWMLPVSLEGAIVFL